MQAGSIFGDSSRQGRPRAVICDRSESTRNMLKETLVSVIEVVGEAADGWAAAEIIRRIGADFIVIDIEVVGLDGVEFCRRIWQKGGISVLVYTSPRYATKYYNQLVRCGVLGFCLKSSQSSVLLEAVVQLVKGMSYCDPALERLVTQAPPTCMPNSELTDRELAVLVRLDWRNKEIAEELDMKLRTVEKHIEVILAKLKVPTRIAAASKAVAMGYVLLPPGDSQFG